MRSQTERLTICATKHFKFKELLDDCFSRDDLIEITGLSLSTINKIATGYRAKRCELTEKEQAVIQQRLNQYDRIFKIVNFYNAKQVASRINMNEHQAYKFYWRYTW